jgi:hypothetical protein
MRVTARVATIALIGLLDSAVCATAQTAVPFTDVPQATPPRRSYTLAYASLATGVALIGVSFVYSNRANHAYDRYLVETDPAEIERLYDRTVHNDRLSSASLLSGNVLVAGGLYLRFLRQPPATRVSLLLGPERCALAWRF